MDDFTPVLTLISVGLVGIMVTRLRAEVKEIKRLLEEALEASRRADNSP